MIFVNAINVVDVIKSFVTSKNSEFLSFPALSTYY